MSSFIETKGKGESGQVDQPIRVYYGVNSGFEGLDIDGNDIRSNTSKFLGTATKISSTGFEWHHGNLLKLGAVYSVFDEMENVPFDTGLNPDWTTIALFRAADSAVPVVDSGLVLFSKTDDPLVEKLLSETGLSESDLPVALFGLRTRLEDEKIMFYFVPGKSTALPAPALTSGPQTLYADPAFSLDDILAGKGIMESRKDGAVRIYTQGSDAEGLALLYIDGSNGIDITQPVFGDEYEAEDSVLHEENEEGRILLARKMS